MENLRVGELRLNMASSDTEAETLFNSILSPRIIDCYKLKKRPSETIQSISLTSQ